MTTPKAKFAGLALIAALVGVLVSGPAWEASAAAVLNQNEKLAYANVHDEMIQCSAYYSLTAELLRKEPNPDKKTIEKLVRLRNYFSNQIAALGRIIGKKVEASLATMRLVFKKMLEEINNDSVNFPILFEKYGALCKVVYQNPDSRIKHWMKEVTK